MNPADGDAAEEQTRGERHTVVQSAFDGKRPAHTVRYGWVGHHSLAKCGVGRGKDRRQKCHLPDRPSGQQDPARKRSQCHRCWQSDQQHALGPDKALAQRHQIDGGRVRE